MLTLSKPCNFLKFPTYNNQKRKQESRAIVNEFSSPRYFLIEDGWCVLHTHLKQNSY